MLPEGKCRYIDGQIYPDGNFYVLDTQHIKHNGNELKSALNGISTDISNKVDKETGKGLSTNDYTTAEKNKLSGIEANANNYVHPTTSGNKHIPSGGSAGKILGWDSDGTAKWVDDHNTTYSDATTSTHGLMSAADKSKLNGIATGANKIGYELKSVSLNSLSWTQTAVGVFYSSKVSIPNLSKIFGMTIYGFANLRYTDVITPKIYGDNNFNGISFLANTGSFHNGAALDLLVFGLST